MKIGIGSVQFGGDYGISNIMGKTPSPEVASILALAAAKGASVIDTSPLYGDSEAMLGKLMPSGHGFRIVTKTRKFMTDRITNADADALEDTFVGSLQNLRMSSVYGLLVHQLDDLLAPDGCLLVQRLLSLKRRGLVEKVGLSLSRFTEDEIDRVLEIFPIDLIQLPLNVLDQRLLSSGRLRKLKAAGVEVHARSVFLQGLLLLSHNKIPPWFAGVKDRLRQYHDEMAQLGISAARAALGFVLAQNDVDIVICGINDTKQLHELIAAAEGGMPEVDFARFAITDERIVNPTNWQVRTA